MQQPTLDIIHTDDKWTKWEIDQNGYETLISYGAYGDDTMDPNTQVKMYLPLYEAFAAWSQEYTVYDENASFYTMLQNAAADVTLMGKAQNVLGTFESDLQYSTRWNAWNTTIEDATVTYDTDGNEIEREVVVTPELKYYGVYEEPKVKDFTLKFASLLNHSDLKMASGKETLVVNTGTHDVFISNDDIVAMTQKKREFVLFDGIDANGNVADRETLNDARGFNEDIRPFVDPMNYVVTAKNVGDNKPVTVKPIIVDMTSDPMPWVVDATTGTIEPKVNTPSTDAEITVYLFPSSKKYPVGDAAYPNGLPAVESGFVIQLGQDIDYRQPIEVTITVKDELGYGQDLKVVVQKLQ